MGIVVQWGVDSDHCAEPWQAAVGSPGKITRYAADRQDLNNSLSVAPFVAADYFC
jgi:hypothetical protein